MDFFCPAIPSLGHHLRHSRTCTSRKKPKKGHTSHSLIKIVFLPLGPNHLDLVAAIACYCYRTKYDGNSQLHSGHFFVICTSACISSARRHRKITKTFLQFFLLLYYRKCEAQGRRWLAIWKASQKAFVWWCNVVVDVVVAWGLAFL
jgi:hypothetical protein